MKSGAPAGDEGARRRALDARAVPLVSGVVGTHPGEARGQILQLGLGLVRFEGDLGRGGALELESQSGSIGLRVPASTVADYDVLTIEGTISNALSDAHPAPLAATTRVASMPGWKAQ